MGNTATGTALCIDIETDGLDPTEIFVLSILDLFTGQMATYTSAEGNIAEGLLRLLDADLICAHYGYGFDFKVIERLTEGLVTIDRAKAVDTVALAMALFPQMPNQKLRTWAVILDPDFPKGDWPSDKFDKFDWGMVPYCERDTAITGALFWFLIDCLFAGAADQKAA